MPDDSHSTMQGWEPAEYVLPEEATRTLTTPHWRALFDSLSDGICLVDQEGLILHCNRPMVVVFGRPLHAILGQSYIQLVRELIAPGDLPNFESLSESPEPPPLELCCEKRWFRVSLRSLQEELQAVSYTLHIWTDITERKIAEGAERERTQLLLERARIADHLALLLESTAEGIYGVDQDGRCTFVNRAAAKMLGYAPGDMVGLKMHTATGHQDHQANLYPEEQCPLCQAYRSGQPISVRPEHIRRKDGTLFSAQYSSYPIHEGGSRRGAVVTFADNTERERLEQELRQAQKMEAVGRLAGGIAHDFNNLLTIILGYSDMLRAKSLSDPDKALVQEICKAGERAALLTRRLLTFSRKQVVESKVLDLNAIVSDTNKMLRRLLGENITLNPQLAPGLGRVKADPVQLEQVIMNLAANARDAMPDGGTLTIETVNHEVTEATAAAHHDLRPGHYVLLRVTDTGCGLSEEAQAHLFEPFFTTKEVGKGTGLGLSTIYAVIKQCGGRIEVASKVGHGTTFTIYLPREQDPLTPKFTEPPKTHRPQGSPTVLVAEDEDVIRGLIRLVLRWNGYNVLEAANGQEALALCHQHTGPIHLLITDVIMPGMNGRELAKRLQILRKDLKVLYISGYTDGVLDSLGVLEVEACFLQKPFSPDALASKVRALLADTHAYARS